MKRNKVAVTTTRANLSFSAQSDTKLGTSSVCQVCWFIGAELFYSPYPDKFLVHRTPFSALLLLFSKESKRFQIHPTTFGREKVARQPVSMSSGPVSTCLMLTRLNDDTFLKINICCRPFVLRAQSVSVSAHSRAATDVGFEFHAHVLL